MSNEPRERWMSYMRGWRDGAAAKETRTEFVEHKTRPDLAEAYKLGHKLGMDARHMAAKRASNHYGYHPSILRGAQQ